ncbi:conserved hypothetical protein [Culex quinquefasciatus]|uniref:G-protein coupled receptors family 1 profile domain-containing protein n=1 Tax=Culex quinquefasciatus TaxID=7176 RepID=B0XHD7_CULQU|nr:conserved hypothetical protein [Culex quinquefasciatus]|eukprot:XP_001869059.1 conserved hypothetical protein [Culex quinquefasciatus]
MQSNSSVDVFWEGGFMLPMVLSSPETSHHFKAGWYSTSEDLLTSAELNSSSVVLKTVTTTSVYLVTTTTTSKTAVRGVSDRTPPTVDVTQRDPNYDQQTFLHYAEVLSVINFYYVPALVLFGSIGNILSVLVFFKTKLKKLSSSYYLAALGLSDTCYLFGLFITWLNLIDVKIHTLEVYCQFLMFLSNLCSFLSVWFVVAFTVERFIAVLYPLKRQTMCTVRRAKMVISALTLIGVFISMPVIFFASPLYSPTMNETICDMPEEYKDLVLDIYTHVRCWWLLTTGRSG